MIVPSSLPARARFAAVSAEPEEDVDLAAAAWTLGGEEEPDLSPAAYLTELVALADRVRSRLGGEVAPLIILQEMNAVLFEVELFRGNAAAYNDPRNSFLNDVLERRVGIPISLSLVYLEVGWRLGLPL